MNSHITLKELLRLVPEKTVGRAPSVRKIRTTGIPVAVSEDGNAVCYSNGFICYTSVSGTTVFPVRKCKGYTYDSTRKKNIRKFSESEMLEFEWYIAVMMYGESRLEHNQESRNLYHHYEFAEDDEEGIEGIADNHQPEIEDSFLELCSCLTERQRTMIIYSFVYGYTHEEIAEILKVKRTTVTNTIANALKSIRKIVQSDEI
ncbi:MAG: sigma-70 family RNA polymerase sigma factor [Ruminococcus flavefaciens]|nr:sigma-70 family RNA polymerase sigma factor [Ruminococcus flavefaciens]MCM1061816.1 sigma-70 family RNA polymerase sigma factor [Eubacterium sp.]